MPRSWDALRTSRHRTVTRLVKRWLEPQKYGRLIRSTADSRRARSSTANAARTGSCRLHRLHQRAAGAKLAARGELDIDLAVGGVLDVLLQVELHDRIAARRAQHIGRGQRHGVSAACSRSRSSCAVWAAASSTTACPPAPATMAAVKPPVRRASGNCGGAQLGPAHFNRRRMTHAPQR
jgi:hypothetical protein